MIDLNKSREFFDPSMLKDPVHIIGCGAIGSHVAECLARLGVQNVHLWDDDTVESHNIANQMFKFEDIGKAKVTAVAELMSAINPGIEVTVHNERTQEGQMFKGYVILCVDSIVPRKQVVTDNQFYGKCRAIFDFRMGLVSGQFYAATTATRMACLLKTMDFTDEEADALTPKTACNFELSVVYTIKVLVGVGVSEIVRVWKGEEVNLTTLVSVDETPSITVL